MLSHYCTLFHLAKELNDQIHSSTIIEIFTQERNELIITFTQGGKESSLIISCEAKHNYIFIKEKFLRAKKNTVNVFNEMIGESVTKVFLDEADRVLVLESLSGKKILCAMFGSNANCFLVDNNEILVSTFKKFELEVGKKFFIEKKTGIPLHITYDSFLVQLAELGGETVFIALKKILPSLGSMLVKEV